MSGFEVIWIQAGYYFIVMVITIFLIGIFQKGFWGHFVRVKLSFGRLLMVKIKAVNRDYFRTGRIEDGFLIYKSINKDEEEKRMVISDSNEIYYAVGCRWIDVHEELNCILSPDLSGVTGFDAVKFSNLYVRALTKPVISDKKEKILIMGFFLLVVLMVVVGFLVYKQGMQLDKIAILITETGKGVLVAGS